MPQLHRLNNGLTLCLQRIEGVASVAVHALLPAGCVHDTDESDGIATMHAEYLLRGTHGRDAKALTNALDANGFHRGVSAGAQHLHLHGSTTGSRVQEALALLAEVIRTPALHADDLEAVRSLCLLALGSLHDDAEEVCTTTLHAMHRPQPLHRSGYGTRDVLETVDINAIRNAWTSRVAPKNAVLAIAGHIDPETIIDAVEAQFADWEGPGVAQAPVQAAPRGRHCVHQDTAQMHLALALDAPDACAKDVDAARLAAHVLGGGSSSRLFLEVRQRRSLCYGIGARWMGSNLDGFIQIATGTTPDRATDTLDTTLKTIQDAGTSITDEEVGRAQLQFRSGIVRAGESTRARAAAMGRDMAVYGRVYSLHERIAAIESVTPDAVRAIAARWATMEPTVVAVGPETARPW